MTNNSLKPLYKYFKIHVNYLVEHIIFVDKAEKKLKRRKQKLLCMGIQRCGICYLNLLYLFVCDICNLL